MSARCMCVCAASKWSIITDWEVSRLLLQTLHPKPSPGKASRMSGSLGTQFGRLLHSESPYTHVHIQCSLYNITVGSTSLS